MRGIGRRGAVDPGLTPPTAGGPAAFPGDLAAAADATAAGVRAAGLSAAASDGASPFVAALPTSGVAVFSAAAGPAAVAAWAPAAAATAGFATAGLAAPGWVAVAGFAAAAAAAGVWAAGCACCTGTRPPTARSAARSGARPAHSRRRFTSRAWEKYRAESTASPGMAAMPAYAPTCSINRTASTDPTLLGVAERNRGVRHPAPLRQHRHHCRKALGVARVHELLDLGERLLDPLRVERRALRNEDPVLAGRARPLVAVEQLLVQLLAWPAADDLDRHVAVGLATRELDHLACEVDDPDRFAHFEHVDLAAPAEL